MNKNYADAVESGFSYWDHATEHSPVVGELVTIGYRAALEEAVRALESIEVSESKARQLNAEGAGERGRAVVKSIALDKLRSAMMKFEETRQALDIKA